MNKRLFFALDISANDKQTIAYWRDQTLKLPFKAITKNNFHITLAFLGNTNAEQQQKLINGANILARPITANKNNELQLDHIGLFKKPKVMYLGLHTCPNWLHDLANNLSKAALAVDLHQENRPYCPHLSIYRKATPITHHYAVNFSLVIKSFSLYQSISQKTGVTYCPINTWQLR